MKFVYAVILSSLISQTAHASNLACINFAPNDLEALIEEAERLFRADQKDENLAQLLTATANQGIDIENMTDLQLNAFRLAGLIKAPPKKEWKRLTRYKNNPKTLELGAFPERGIDFVRAHIIMSELTLNGKTQERLLGVTYEVSLTPGDGRSRDLEAVTEGKISTWEQANSEAKYKRRKRLIHILKEKFDYLARGEDTRLLHAVVSLARHKSILGSYVLPKTQIDPISAFSLEDQTLTENYEVEMRNHFLSVLSGERDVTVLTGYQNGNARNPSHRR